MNENSEYDLVASHSQSRLDHAPSCCIQDCDRPFYARGLCNLHYKRWRTHGDPRIVAKSGKPKGVYVGEKSGNWKGTDAGYVQKHQRVINARGKPPKCEDCGITNPKLRYEWACINGDYDDIGAFLRLCVSCHRTRDARRVTHCLRGHEYTPENTYIHEKSGARQCRLCSKERQRERYQRMKDVLNERRRQKYAERKR